MREDKKALISTSMAHFSNDGVFLLFSSLIVYYSQPSTGLNITILGYFATIYILVSGIASIPIGRLSDSRDMDPELMFVGILIIGLSVVLFAIPFSFSSTTSLLIKYLFAGVGAIVLGFGQAFYHPLGASIIRTSLRGKDSSTYLGINGSFGSMGRAILLFIVGVLIIDFNPFFGLLLFSIYYFVASVIIYLSSRSLRKNGINIKSKPKPSTLKPMKEYPGVIGFLSVLTSTIFLRSVFLMAIATYTFKYIDSTYHSNYLSFLFLSSALTTPILGQPVFGILTKKIGGNRALLASTIISLMAFTPFILITENFYISLSLFSIYSFAAFTGFPSILGFVGQKIPLEITTRASTWTWGIGSTLGGATGVMIVTEMHNQLNYSFRFLFEIMLIFLLLSAITNLFIGKFSSRLENQINIEKTYTS